MFTETNNIPSATTNNANTKKPFAIEFLKTIQSP